MVSKLVELQLFSCNYYYTTLRICIKITNRGGHKICQLNHAELSAVVTSCR